MFCNVPEHHDLEDMVAQLQKKVKDMRRKLQEKDRQMAEVDAQGTRAVNLLTDELQVRWRATREISPIFFQFSSRKKRRKCILSVKLGWSQSKFRNFKGNSGTENNKKFGIQDFGFVI